MAVFQHIDIDGTTYDLPPAQAVNNGTLTIQKNGTNVATFTANQSTNATANITVPTKVSELTNDSGYTTNTGTVTQVKVGSTAYNPSSGVVSLPAYPTVPTVNNGTLTIQKNGTNVATFTANQSTNATANITVPTVNNGTLTIQKNGTNVATFTANQSGNSTANVTVPTLTTLGTANLTSDTTWKSTGITIPTYYGLVYLQFASTGGVASYSCIVSTDLLRASTESLPFALYRGSYLILFKCINNVLYYFNNSGGTAALSAQVIRF